MRHAQLRSEHSARPVAVPLARRQVFVLRVWKEYRTGSPEDALVLLVSALSESVPDTFPEEYSEHSPVDVCGAPGPATETKPCRPTAQPDGPRAERCRRAALVWSPTAVILF